MGLVDSAFAQLASLQSRVSAWLTATPQLYPDRFAHTHEFERLRSEHWLNETGLLIGTSAFNQVLTVRPTPKRRELGNVFVCAPPRSGIENYSCKVPDRASNMLIGRHL